MIGPAAGAAIVPRVRAAPLLARDDWDAIVVGSGVGSLICAALLASRASMRVLVLERHYEPGGLTQSFRRRRFAWDVGVHYLGDVAPGAMLRRVYDAASGGRLDFVALPPRHDRLFAPGDSLALGGDRDALRAQWLAGAPGEDRAVDRILAEIDACARAAPQHFLARMRDAGSGADRGPERSPFFTWSDRTTADVLRELGASPRLAALVTYTWTDYGAPPERSSFAAHAVATQHYLGGAFYPVGGGGAIARALAATIAAHGGAVVVRAEVDEVLLEHGAARGVRLAPSPHDGADAREIRAPIVVSGTGARITAERLLREPTELRERARAIGPSDAHVGLYLGLAAEPRALGLDGANLWIHRDPLGTERARDADAWARGDHDGDPPDLFVGTACARDPAFGERFPGRTAITAAVATSYEPFARFASSLHARRDPAYRAHKDLLARGMLRLLARHLPLDALAHVEVSTPLSTAHFAGHAHGEVYGLDPTPLRFRTGPRPHSGIPGLYLTGQDVWMCGVGGAASAGVLTACAVLRRDLPRELALGGRS